MAKQYDALDARLRSFIGRQRIFFTASAAPMSGDGSGGEVSRVNVSPRPTDCLRVLSDNAVCYLDRTGSGNETAAHARAGGNTTVMFCAVEGPPLILRLYGVATIHPHGTPDYDALFAMHYDEEPLGTRQIVRLDFDLVQTSCGYGVPLFAYEGERPSMDNWAEQKIEENGPTALKDYRREKNARSIDGLPTWIAEEA